MTLRVVILTCNKYQWLLQPMAYLFGRYWSDLQPVVVGGFSQPNFYLPANFSYHQIAQDDYPPEKWSNGFIKLLMQIPDLYVVVLLEDYFLSRTVDHELIISAYSYMLNHPEVLRFDLTNDRLYAGGMFDVESFGRMDIIETPHDSPYQFSLQAGIWNKKLLFEVLSLDKSAWKAEIESTVPGTMRVLGCRQNPVRYINAMYQGKLQYDKIAKLPAEHLDYMNRKGWFNRA